MDGTESLSGEGPHEKISRRSLLAVGAAAGGGLVAATLAACTPAAATAGWTFPPARSAVPGAAATPVAPSTAASAAASAAPSASAHAHDPSASGAPSADHDANAKAVVDRFLGGEGASMSGTGNLPLQPTLDGSTKVFDLTVDAIKHQTTPWSRRAAMPSGSTARGRARGSRSSRATRSARRSPTAWPSRPASTSTASGCRTRWTACRTSRRRRSRRAAASRTSSTAKSTGSHMYHSHHNATDQVGRGLLGAFIVQPKDPALRYDQLYGATQDIVWISNDALGGFTINGRELPRDGADRRQARRDDRDPVHERGEHDPPVAPPRDADARRGARRARRSGPRRSRATRWASTRASAGTSSSPATSPAPGPSTATSCPTRRDRTGCTAWSRRSSSRTPRRP